MSQMINVLHQIAAIVPQADMLPAITTSFAVADTEEFFTVSTKQALLAHVQDGRLGIVVEDTITQVVGLKKYASGKVYYKMITSNGAEHCGSISQIRVAISSGKYYVSNTIRSYYDSTESPQRIEERRLETEQRVADDALIEKTFNDIVANYGEQIERVATEILNLIKVRYDDEFVDGDGGVAMECITAAAELRIIRDTKCIPMKIGNTNPAQYRPWYCGYLQYTSKLSFAGLHPDNDRSAILNEIKVNPQFTKDFAKEVMMYTRDWGRSI